eukprot:TRINITY_DN32366_c0_g1_i1.p1 TRINITY_DN32366_c0_g1~~TRINITY_DN32366_c0_g1_i1.p1  ORF type:complete len:764 (-),score=100.08 TRINITY_DN32366_c0_g1_i1:934-3225(-)
MTFAPGGQCLSCPKVMACKSSPLAPLASCQIERKGCISTSIQVIRRSCDAHLRADVQRQKLKVHHANRSLNGVVPRKEGEAACLGPGLGPSVSDGTVRRNLRVAASLAVDATPCTLEQFQQTFEAEKDARSRTRRLLQLAEGLPRLANSSRTRENLVMGCTSQVWVTAELAEDGKVLLGADSDSELTRGLCAILVKIFSGMPPEAILSLSSSALDLLSKALGSTLQQPSRINGFHAIFQAMQRRTNAFVQSPTVTPFPSLLITSQGNIEAQGDFALAQAKYLQPDFKAVDNLTSLLSEKKIGVVAHFYMDPEVQGVLVGVQQKWPHIHISDSLIMADSALAMAAAGCTRIAVLGVDFMAENVRAILDRGGYSHVPVLRMSSSVIGCSLADAARSDEYLQYLTEASQASRGLHVIYINTSLDTKAKAHSLIPTITCTSSNVVQTVLQAFAQVPDLALFYGPDTYMGGNLAEMLMRISTLSDDEVAEVHPGHTQASIKALLPRLQYFQEGACIVHDLFGQDVVERVRLGYGDAYLTAHFEVPGEMFRLAMEARTRGRGTVGSTQNILDFIARRVQEALEREGGWKDERLQFILGTEVGMVTAIVQKVKQQLAEDRAKKPHGRAVEVEIVFPVSSEAIAPTEERGAASRGGIPLPQGLEGLPLVPGVRSGEGCSVSGGCASCPYMKMNSLDALERVCRMVGSPGELLLAGYAPEAFAEIVDERRVADVGSEPILHMRHFQKTGKLSEELVADIMSRRDPALAMART